MPRTLTRALRRDLTRVNRAQQRLRWRWRQTSPPEAVAAEQGLLALLKTRLLVRDVAVGPTDKHYMHTIEGGRADAPPLVMMPGYAAGAGFFWRNLDSLTQHFRLFAVDWLGTGLSGRPPFRAASREQAEDFFLESLEAWREREGLPRMILLGHSLGGYLAANYALRHPERVQHLVLVCPAGIPSKPEGWESRFAGAGVVRSSLYRLASAAWEAGITPGSGIRALGPWGPGLIDGYVGRRFSTQGVQLSQHEMDVFSKYFYQIAAADGSGEFALRHLLSPGAWAYAPLEQRLRELKVPVTFIYGVSDWMDPRHAHKLVKELDALRPRQVPSDHVVEVLPNSGHFTFLEVPQVFNAALLRTCAPYLPSGAAAAAGAAAATDGSFRVGGSDDDGGGDGSSDSAAAG